MAALICCASLWLLTSNYLQVTTYCLLLTTYYLLLTAYLDLLRVLRAQVKRTRQVDHRLRRLPQLLVHLVRVRVRVRVRVSCPSFLYTCVVRVRARVTARLRFLAHLAKHEVDRALLLLSTSYFLLPTSYFLLHCTLPSTK